MELFYVTFFLFLGGVLAEPSVEVSSSKDRGQIGTNVTITCTVTNAEDNTLVSMKKYVEIDEFDDNGNRKIVEEDVSTDETVLQRYEGRHTVTKITRGESVMDYNLKIQDLKPEDSAIYACFILGTDAYSAKTFEVYTQPTEVHFTNVSDIGVLFTEGETKNIGCMAMGGVPVPRFEITAGERNYTEKFTHHESSVRLPECYQEGSPDTSCLLHFTTDSEVEAMNFRPHYSADSMDLVCKAYTDGSGKEPVTAELKVTMLYKPKFWCWKKHKVALHTVNYELNCTIHANPSLDTPSFEFIWNGVNQKLMPGDKTDDGEIEFLELNQLNNRETEVILKFEKIFERHYETKYNLTANNKLGENSTLLELVDEAYVRGSANVLCREILVLTVCLSFVCYNI